MHIVMYTEWLDSVEILECFSIICCRNRFLSGNAFRASVNVRENREKDSIDVVKFVGCQHTFLTDLMDLLNVCYAFQVLPFPFCASWLNNENEILLFNWINRPWYAQHLHLQLLLWHSTYIAAMFYTQYKRLRHCHGFIQFGLCCNRLLH